MDPIKIIRQKKEGYIAQRNQAIAARDEANHAVAALDGAIAAADDIIQALEAELPNHNIQSDDASQPATAEGNTS